jgi:RHS repeat-associated protein
MSWRIRSGIGVAIVAAMTAVALPAIASPSGAATNSSPTPRSVVRAEVTPPVSGSLTTSNLAEVPVNYGSVASDRCSWSIMNNLPQACVDVDVSFNQDVGYDLQTAIYDGDGQIASAKGDTGNGPHCQTLQDSCSFELLSQGLTTQDAGLRVVTLEVLPGWGGTGSYVKDLTVDPGNLRIHWQDSFSMSRAPYFMTTEAGQTSGKVWYRLNQPIADGLALYIYNSSGQLVDGPLDEATKYETGSGSYAFRVRPSQEYDQGCAVLRTASGYRAAEACGSNYNNEAVHSAQDEYMSAGNDPSAGPITCYAGDPVSCRSGYLVETKNDMTIPGRFPIQLLRSYSSNQGSEDYGLFGYGWSSPFNMELSDHSTVQGSETFGYVTVRQENGAVIKFFPGDGNEWVPEYELPDATLTQESNGSWTFVRKSLLTIKFTSTGEVDWIENHNGVQQDVNRTSNQISVSTEDGRTLTLALNGSGRVTSASGPGGRQVTYGYTNGDLTSVTHNFRTTPSDSADSVLQYGYDTSHRLKLVTSPGGGEVETHYVGDTPKVDYQIDALDETWDFAYGTDSETGAHHVTTTDPTGVQVRYVYEGGTDSYAGNLVRRIIAPGTSSESVWSYAYDDAGRVIVSTDPEGRQALAAYDSEGRLDREVVPVPDTPTSWTSPGLITYEYNGRDQVTGVTRKAVNPTGSVVDHETTYSYDTYGNLTTTTVPLTASTNSIEQRVYESGRPGVLDYIVDARGKTWEYTYDNRGLLSEIDAPGAGGVTGYAADAYGAIESVTLPEGTATSGSPNDYKTTYTYYANSSLLKTATTPTGLVTSYEYDEDAEVSKVTDPGGNTWDYERRPDGRITKVYDPEDNYTEYRFDDAGRPTQEIDPTGVSTKTVYSPVTGLPASVITPRGTAAGASSGTVAAATITLQYNRAGQLLTRTQPDPNGGNVKTTYTYDSYSPAVLSVKSPRNLMTEYSYDPVGQLSDTTLPSESTAPRVESRSYDLAGRLVAVTDPRGNDTEYSYDNAGNVLSVTDRRSKITTYTYDDVGRLKTWTDPRGYEGSATPADYTWSNNYDSNGWLTGVEDPYDVSTVIGYDQDGRQTSFENRSGVTTRQWQYYTSGVGAGRPCLVKASDDGVTAFGYDTLGRTSKIARPDVDGVKNPATATCDTLDFADAVQYGYDDAGRPTTVDEPVLAAQIQSYWPDTGLPRLTTFPKGNTVEVTQDTLGRTANVNYSQANAPDVTYTYNKENQLLTADNGTAAESYTFTYSPDTGEMLTATLGSNAYTYAYNKNSSISSITRPGGNSDTFTYNKEEQVTEVNAGINGVPTMNFDYNAAGQRDEYRVDDHFWKEEFAYDRAGRTSDVIHSSGTTLTNLSPVMTRTITRDADGNPEAIKVDRNGTVEWRNYAYDSEARLVGVCYGSSQATCTQSSSAEWYTYDKAGNRKSMRVNNGTPTNYTYDDANKLTTVGSATLTYDGNGSLTIDQTGRTFTYDGAGRMLTSKESGTSTADKYVYDALGNRIQIQLAGSTTDTRNFRYDVNHPLPVIDQVSSSAGTTNYFHDGESPLAGKQGTDVEWFAHDELGSVTDVYFDNPATTTLKGVRARAFDYQPFGATRTTPGAPSTTYGFVPQFRYTGAVRDDATQYQMRAREYSVDTGRFNQTDPIMPMTGSIGSQYAYVNNQPTMFTDPTGMIGEPSDGGVVGTTSDMFESMFGFDDASEVQNVTTFNSDTALCGATNVYDTAVFMAPAIPVIGPTVGLLHNSFASSFEPRDWLAQQGALNPCSAGCATADNINGAIEVVGIVAGARGVGVAVSRAVAAKVEATAAEKALASLPKSARNSEKPPGFNPETWQWREGSRANVPRSWWDPQGGEWRFHPADKYHDPHWDYNPWRQWNNPWQRVHPGDR